MRTTTVLTAAGLCLLSSNARAGEFPSASVTDGIGVAISHGNGLSLAQASALYAAGARVVRANFVPYLIARPVRPPPPESGIAYQPPDSTCQLDGDYYWCFAEYDAFVQVCNYAGLRVYGILGTKEGFCNPSASCAWQCYGTKGFRDYIDTYIDKTVSHYRGNNFTWELWNEPNGDLFWPHGDLSESACLAPHPDIEAVYQYINLAMGVTGDRKGALQTIRDADHNATDADHDATIVAPALASGVEYDADPSNRHFYYSTDPTYFLQQCFENGLLTSIDALSAHPYRSGNPETVLGEDCDGCTPSYGYTGYAGLHQLMSESASPSNWEQQPGGAQVSAADIPIVSGEWGYTLAWSGITPQVQADYLQRMMLSNFSVKLSNGRPGVPVSIWFQDEDRYDIVHDWYWGLFKNYCETHHGECQDECQDTDGDDTCVSGCTYEGGAADDCAKACDTHSFRCKNYCAGPSHPCANLCTQHRDQCLSCDPTDGEMTYNNSLCADKFYLQKRGYGDPKPAFYAMKTLTSNLGNSKFYLRYRADPDHVDTYVGADNYLMLFQSQTDGREILAAWTASRTSQTSPIPTFPVSDDPWWGSFLLTNTPMYLGQPLTWLGGDWSVSNWSYRGWPDNRKWPNDYSANHDNYQAVFGQGANNATIKVDGEYYVGGFQFGAPNVTLYGGGHLRFTSGGGNLYVANGNFDTIAVSLADTYDVTVQPATSGVGTATTRESPRGREESASET